ncbi:MAG: GNAT family N-acetyltransferase [Chloroflexi bacterium]|nr:GNAT family N-acetyltransferase [Chloroflexota bacterium]
MNNTTLSPTLFTLGSLTFRNFVNDDDYAKTLEVVKAANIADDIEEQPTLDDQIHWIKHLPNFDLQRDMLIVESDGTMVGYALVWWRASDEGEWVHLCNTFLLPDYRSEAIQAAVTDWCETRSREKCVAPESAKRFFQAWVADTATYRSRFLQSKGYAVSRNFFLMRYSPLDHELEVSLPDHLEFRAVKPEHIRPIWEARNEAFRDHWGHSAQMETEAAFDSFKNDPSIDLSIWRVIWDTNENQVAGLSVNSIFKEDNRRYGFKRGWVNSLGVRRPWRKQGVGRILLLESLNALRGAGMTESVLGVDAENPTGALNLYKNAGFKVYKRSDVYRKRF